MADYEACPAMVDSCPTGWMTFRGVLGAFVWTAERGESLATCSVHLRGS